MCRRTVDGTQGAKTPVHECASHFMERASIGVMLFRCSDRIVSTIIEDKMNRVFWMISFWAVTYLSGCDDSAGHVPMRSMSLPSPMVVDVAYYGSAGLIDSAGKNVPARLLFIMKSDSSFKMYVSPASLPLYHVRSQFDLMRIRGKFQGAGEGFIVFSVDSSLSYWSDGRPIRRGKVVVSSDQFYPEVKRVEYSHLSYYSGAMAKGEFQVSHADSNKSAQFELGL